MTSLPSVSLESNCAWVARCGSPTSIIRAAEMSFSFTLFLYLLYVCHGCTEVMLSVAGSSAIDTPGCTNTTGSYRCQDLQTALQFIVNTTDTECHVFYVQLEAGVHVIKEPISTPSSVHITSSNKTEEQPIITCASEVRLDGQLHSNHSIYFNQSNSVTISDVTMEWCPLPLRLFEVHDVRLRNATFRFVHT